MNEQAIQDAYELFKGQGYADSIDDFRILIANNSEALNDAYILFSSRGYEDSIEDFSNLMGTSAIKKKVAEEPMGFDSEVGSLESADTEQDYFTGTFGDALRGLDSVIPIGIGDFVDDMARAVAGGVNQGISSENASDLLLRGSMSTDEDIASYIESQKTAQKLGPSQEMMDYEKIYNEEGKGFWGVVKGLMLNPTVLPEVLVSSMSALASNSDALLAGAATIGTGATYGAGVGALAGGVGAVPGAIAGATAAIPYAFGVASSTLEMGATFGELLQEELGDKEATKENVRAILNDPNKLQSIRNKAVARGIVIGTIDAFTGKLASGVGAKILTKSAAKSATNVAAKSAIVKSTAAGSAIEAAGGSIGEIGGRLVAGQEMDTSEILLEGLAELPGGVRSTVTAQLQKPQYKVNGKIESVETVDNLIATMTPAQLAVSNIEIKNDKARQVEVQKKVVKGKTLQDVKEANPELNDATADAIADIEIQIDALSSNLTQSGRAKRTALKEQIQNLQENQIQEEAAVDVAETAAAEEADVDTVDQPITAEETTADATDQPITAEDVVGEQTTTEAKDDSSPIEVESIVDDVTGEVKPVTEEMVSEADALEGDLGSAYTDILSAAPEATTETPNEIVYEMNKTDKKIWSKDFEIIDNRNGEEDAEGAKWMVRNVVTGYMVDAKSKKDAQYIIDNAPAEAELFGEGEKVEIDTKPEITNVNKELENDLEFYFGKIEDIQDEINNERAVKKADVAELKSKLAEVRKDKTLSRDEKVERIEDIKAEIDDFIENQDMVIGDLKLDLDDAKKQAKSTQRKIDKQKTNISSQKNETGNIRSERTGDGGGRNDSRTITPLEGTSTIQGAAGPDAQLVAVAEQYAQQAGIDLKRQAEYVRVDEERAKRLADEYENMTHDPQNPKVKKAYAELIKQTKAQYQALVDAGYKFWFMDLNNPENKAYAKTPYNAMRDLRSNKQMGVFPTTDGFGTEEFDVNDNPMLADTGIKWPVSGMDGEMKPVLANDLFRAVHDAFGHGLEGAGFRARGEENAWQAHIRLFTGDAIAAVTSETRGQNSWVNYGPKGEQNRKASADDTIFADQKTGLMPSWTWSEGRAGDATDAKFRLQEEGDDVTTVDPRDYDLDLISMEMLELGGGEMNFTVPLPEGVTLSPIGESRSSTKLTDSDAKELGFDKVSDMEKQLEAFEDIPMLKAISDILAGGTYKDAVGNDLKLKGGMMFNAIAKVKAAWAGVKGSVSSAQYKNAVKLYNVHKDLFDRLWKEGRLPDGHIPMAIIRMANDAVLSNEAVFRYLVPEIKNQSIKNQTAAMNDLIEGFKTKAAPQNKKILKFISDKKITNLGQFLDEIVLDATERAKGDIDKTLTLDERTIISKNLLSLGDVDAPAKKFLKSLYNGSKKDNSKIFIANNIYQAIGEPAMLKTKKGDVVSIVGIDVKNGGVVDIDHPNYGTGPAGRLIALITNPKNGINVFPEWRAKASRVFKKSKSAKGDGKAPSESNLLNQVMGTAANDLAFQGSAVTSEMTDMKILLGKLRFAFPNVGVLTTKQDFDAILKQPGVRTKMSEGKVILGLTIDGKVYINPETSSLATPIHEFGHIWIDFLRSKQGGAKGAALLKRGLKLVEGTQALKTAIEKYGDNKLAREEALVELMATKGEDLIGESKKSFKEWMNGVFKYIKAKFVSTEVLFKREQIKKLNAEKKEINKKAKITDADKKRIQEIEAEVKAIDASAISSINKMSLDDFINAGLADLFKGSVVSKSFDPKAASQGGMARYELGDSVSNFIADAKKKGYSNDAIRLVLERRGVDKNKITEAFRNVVDAVAQDNAEIDALIAAVQAVVDRRVSRGGDVTRMIARIDKIVRDSDIYKRSDDATKRMLEANARAQADVQQKRAPSIGRIIAAITDIANITSADKLKIANSIIQLAKTAQKELSLELKGMATKGTITVAQQTAIMNRMLKVNFLNEASISNFVDYMANVFRDVEYATKITAANKFVKKARTNIKTKLGKLTAMSGDLDRLFAIKPSMIPISTLDTYMQIVESFGGSAAVLDVQEVSAVARAVEDILNAMDQEYSLADELANRFEASNNLVIEDGKINFAKSIANMLKEKEITEDDAELMRKYKTDIVSSEPKAVKTDAEIQAEKDELIDQINKADVMQISALPSADERDLAKRFEKLIGTNAIKGMSVRDLKNILKLIDNVNNGYLPHLVQVMVEKMNADTNSKVVNNSINNSRILAVTGIYSKLKAKVTKKGWVTEMIRRNPLFYIDQLFGDYQSKGIFNSVFGGSAIGVAKFDADIKRVFGILNKAQKSVAESFDNNGNRTLASKFLQQIYLSQLEYETNIGNPEVNQVSKFVKATIKAIDSNKTSFTELEADLLEKMLADKRYLDADGEFNSQKIYDTFNSAEKASIAAIQDVYKSLEEKASFTAAVIRGKRITPRNNYVHLNVIAQDGAQDLMTSPSEIQTYSNGMNPSTRGQSLTERTGTVSPLNFDVYASASRGAKFVLMDYHLTEPIRTARRTINATKKLLRGDKVRIDKNEREIINAIEEGFEEATMNLLTNSYMQTAWLDDALDYIKKNGYRAILASAPRFVAELSSNTAFALISDSTSFTAGTDLGIGFLSSVKAPDVMYNLGSTETTRLYNDEGLTGRLVDTSSLNASDIKTRKSKGDTVNSVLQIWDNSLGKVQGAFDKLADAMISTPDKLVMRPMWFGSFSTSFERITGNKPDFDKIAANDEAYMTENKEALSKAKTQADERSVMTGSTNNAFMGLLKGTNKPNQSLQLKAFNSFNNFMSTFLIFEYVTARTGVMNAMGRGSLTQQQGAAIIAASATRMVMYTFLAQMLSEMVAEMFGLGEDEEEDKSADKRFGQAIASSATSLILGRDFGNATKAIINYGVEQGNKEFLGFLRENDPVTGKPKYDVYKDGIQYQAIPADKNGRGTTADDWLKSLSAAYGPAIKSLLFILKKATEKEKEGEAEKQLQSDEKSIRIPLEVLGNLGFVPMYKDVRKLVLKSLYEEMAREQRKSETNAAIEKQKLGPYENKTDMKRYDPDMYYNTFGPGAPDYDEIEAKRILDAAERKLRQYEKDQTFDYNPSTGNYNSNFGRKKKVGGFGTNDGFGSSSFGSESKTKRRGKSRGDGFNTN